MKVLYSVLGIGVTIGVITAAIFGTSWYLQAHEAKILRVACSKTGTAHAVTIHDSVVSPEHTDAKICDTLTVTNEDNRLRLMAFGAHDHHQAYGGITEKVLSQNQHLTITFNQAGTYEFHDHLEDTVIGYFTVR